MALTPLQVKALDVLLETKTQRAAAKILGIWEGTISNWKREPDFVEALAKRSREKFGDGILLAQRQVLGAFQRLALEMDAATPNKDRIAAANNMLDKAIKYHEQIDVRDRIDKLTRLLGDQETKEGEE